MSNKYEIDEILMQFHIDHFAQSVDGVWYAVIRDTKIKEAKQQLLALKKKWEQEQTFKVIQSLVKSGGISDQLASTTLNIFTINGDK